MVPVLWGRDMHKYIVTCFAESWKRWLFLENLISNTCAVLAFTQLQLYIHFIIRNMLCMVLCGCCLVQGIIYSLRMCTDEGDL